MPPCARVPRAERGRWSARSRSARRAPRRTARRRRARQPGSRTAPGRRTSGRSRPSGSADSARASGVLDVNPETTEVVAAAEEGDLEAREAAYEKFVWDNLKRNYLGNYLHGMLGMTGFRLINAPTFLPAYLHQVSGSSAV